MLKYIVIGSTLAFTAAIQPGPFQAYLFSRVTAIGWRKTLPAALAPLLSDGPIALIALFILGRLSPPVQSVLRIAGGGLLLFFAWGTFRQWRRFTYGVPKKLDKIPRTLFEAALVDILNPNPYIGWTLILGPVVIGAWRETPSAGIAVVAAFYATMILTLAVIIYAFGGARLFGPKFQRGLLFLSGIILAGLGVYQLMVGIRYLAAIPF